MIITSKTNSKVKLVKSLNEKKYRKLNNCFYLEGIKVVNEVLDLFLEKKINIISIIYSNEILSKTNGAKQILTRIGTTENIEVLEFDSNIFNYVTDTVNSQGILVIVSFEEKTLKNINLDNNIIVLDKIQDLGNLGSIIRSADSFDFKNLICLKGTADCYVPKVVRSTMCSILRTNIIYVDNYEELKNFLKTNNYEILTTSLNANNRLPNIDKNNKIAVILGNEANGVSKECLDMADEIIRISMNNKVDSLNVSSAASIIMHQIYCKNNNLDI